MPTPESEAAPPRTFEQFAKEIKDSCESHAHRKNYTSNDIDGQNRMRDVTKALGVSREHACAEMVYKIAEYLKTPRRLLLVKVAGWAFMEWKDCDQP